MPVNWSDSVYPTGPVPGQASPVFNKFRGRFDGNHPTSGTFAVGEWTIDCTTPGIWLCTTAGSPGTWQNAFSSGGAPSGPAGGDLGGTYPNPDVEAIDGVVLSGVAPTTGQVLTATGAAAAGWATPSGAVSSVFTRTGAVVATSGDYTAAQVTNAADLSAAGDQDFTGQVSAPRLEVNGGTGASLPIRWIGGNASGAPASGTWEARDGVLNTDGTAFICTVAGTPGTWVQVGGGGGTGTTLLAAVAGTDGATASLSVSYAAWSTPWTASVTTTATADVIVEIEMTVGSGAVDAGVWIEILRGGTQVYSGGEQYLGAVFAAGNYCSFRARFVDKALAAGTYTYETRPGSNNASVTLTLRNGSSTTPGPTAKGQCMMTVSQAANV